MIVVSIPNKHGCNTQKGVWNVQGLSKLNIKAKPDCNLIEIDLRGL